MGVSQKRQISVLVVDDSEMNRRLVREALKRYADIEILGEVENGREAVEIVKKSRPDVILMDFEMPVLSGVEATQEIAAFDPTIRVVFFSSNTGMSDIHAAFSAGALGYVFKDAPAKLGRAIRAAYAGKRFFEP